MPANDSSLPPYRARISGTRHAAASGHYLAAQAGLQVLEAGGNAVDAGVAGGLMLGVVESLMVGFAGVAPILIYLADRDEVVTISGVGTWPKSLTCQHFHDHHGGLMEGALQTVVPGAPDAWITALEAFGTMSFGAVAEAAIRYARDGFPMYRLMSEIVAGREDDFRAMPGTGEIYLPGGHVPRPGDLFVQTDLARTIQYLADEETAHAKRGREAGLQAARDAFYRGDIAAKIARHQKETGGQLTVEDMAGFRVRIEPPCRTRFAGDTDVFTGGPWCQGPMMLEVLNILDGMDPLALGHNSTRYIHAVVEAIKLAAADREAYFGDPLFVDVPVRTLLSATHAAERRQQIQDDRAWPEMPPPARIAGAPWPSSSDAKAGLGVRTGAAADMSTDTSFICVVDGHGNTFAATPSDGNGGAPVVPGTGIVPSGRGKGGRTDPAHPACVAPGKRPRMTNGPALAVRDGRWLMPFGTPGSDNQLQAMTQVLLNVAVFGMDPQDAVEAPRFNTHSFPQTLVPDPPHSYEPASLYLEGRIDRATGKALADLGHRVTWWPDWGPEASHADIATVCAILANDETGILHAAHDPRRVSGAMAV